MVEISISAIKERLEKKRKDEEARIQAEKERFGDWNKLTTRQKYSASSIENMRRTQQLYFKRKIKVEYPELLPHEPELFAEFFELMLDDKVKNMIDFLSIKYKEVQNVNN